MRRTGMLAYDSSAGINAACSESHILHVAALGSVNEMSLACKYATKPRRSLGARLRHSPALGRFLSLCSVEDRVNRHSLASDPVQNDVGSAADDQLADSGLGSGATQVRVISWILNKRHDPRCQSFCCGGLVDSHIGADFGEARGPEETR